MNNDNKFKYTPKTPFEKGLYSSQLRRANGRYEE